jgi:hypothetical protein
MTTDSSYVESLRSEFREICSKAEDFFRRTVSRVRGHELKEGLRLEDHLTREEEEVAKEIRLSIAEFGPRLIEAVRKSALLEQTDEAETRRLLRALAASLLLREFTYHSSYVVSEEDRVFGIVPAEQAERPSRASECFDHFKRDAREIFEKIDLLAPTPDNLTRAIVSSQTPGVRKYRPNTAFIMMQIDERVPRLEDVKNCIKEVFKEFGITAVRSDEIEHSDVITQRILDEIATSEFLIADLSGERPSVYYEVGFAHACGKRPLLYREEGTVLHFDLKVHNVPEYKNTTDLKNKLRTRLAAMTNRATE